MSGSKSVDMLSDEELSTKLVESLEENLKKLQKT